MGKMQAEIDKLNQAIDSLRKLMKKLGEQLAQGGKGGPVVIAGDSVSREEFDKLVARVDALEELLNKQLAKLRDDLDSKASLHDLANLQANLMDKLNELMANLENMFADKEGTRKKLAQLEKALKQLHELMKNLQTTQSQPTEDDAMFTKKYVGPVDCASCEKGIVNLCGLRADNVNWNRLPFREPTERIARYGQGFSKFLAATGVVVDGNHHAQMRQSSASRHP
jgi:DNA repair exonuclease SbcCD ATPase subunit